MNESTTIRPDDLRAQLSDRKLVGIWRLLQEDRGRYLLAGISLGIAACGQAGTYLLLRFFVDEVLGAQANLSQLLPWIAAGFVGLALLQGSFTYLSGRLAGRSAESVARRLRNFLYDHIQHLPFDYHDRSRTGELLQRSTSDVDALRRFYVEQATGAGRILALFVVNMAVLLNLHAGLALASVVLVPITLVMSYFFFRRVSGAYEAYQEQDANLSTALQENLSGVRVVKAFARQAYESDKFESENWKKYLLGRRLLTMHSLYWPISDIITGAQMLFGFYLGARLTIAGVLSIGTYLAYAGLIIWIIWPIRNLGRLIVQMSTGMVSYGRVAEVIRELREPLDDGVVTPAGPPRGELRFEAVSFAYSGDPPVLQDLTFDVQPGQTVALLGATGSGKTSLVNLLPRFYEYSTGSLQLDGMELNEISRRYLRRHIGIVEQEPFLFSRTIRENIAIGVGRAVEQEEIEAAARSAAIHDVILSFPKGYDTLVGERGVTLSGGQKQRLAIARTLLKDPAILILDDSTSSVDTETEALIRQALDHLMEGRTTFVIAHRVQSLMRADLILVLEHGRIVQRGRHETLVDQPGRYRRVYEMQTRIESELQEEMTGV